jgi:hypothetical protein
VAPVGRTLRIKDDPDITTDYHRKSICEWAER